MRLLHALLASTMVLSACASHDSGETPDEESAPVASHQESLVTPPRLAMVGAEGTRVLLSDDPSDALVGGAPELVRDGELVVVRRSLTAADLSPANAAWVGRRVRLLGKDGAVCDGVASRVVLEGRALSTTEFDDEGTPIPAATRTAEEAWELASSTGRLAIVAEIDANGDCKGAIWAQPSAEAAPTTFVPTPADDATATRAVAAFRALPLHEEIQAQYLESEERAFEHWDQMEGATTIQTFPATAAGQGRLVVVTSEVDGGCGGFNGHVTAIFRDDAGVLTLLNDPSETQAFVPVAATDSDGDGQVDFLTETELRRGETFQVRHESEVPYHGCGC